MDQQAKADTLEWNNAKFQIKLKAQESGGNIGIFESTDPPGFGPPRHIHHDADETFLVQSGDVEFWMEGETVLRTTGEVIFIPRGKQHTYRVAGERPARMITIMTPGGFEAFFPEVAKRNLKIPQDMADVVSVGEKFNLTFTGPPLGAE